MELADGTPYLEEVKGLIREYTEWLGRDLAFQGLEDELAFWSKFADEHERGYHANMARRLFAFLPTVAAHSLPRRVCLRISTL